jgi:HIV Tat-specific factor 1
MDGRSFAGQVVRAYVSDGKESFKKSKKKQDEDMKMQETSSTKA